jgi:hypothetical protein
MRSRRAVAVCALALAGVMTLSACTPQQSFPRGPSDAEVDAAVQELLDMRWTASGLEGVVERPDIDAEVSIAQWNPAMDECLAQLNEESYGWSDSDGFMLGTGERGTDAQQLAFYECFARFPAVAVFSREQREYIYDYYLTSLVPCLGLHGHATQVVPSRRSFVAGTDTIDGSWLWSPYSAMTELPEDMAVYDRLLRECPPTIAGVDGRSAPPGE